MQYLTAYQSTHITVGITHNTNITYNTFIAYLNYIELKFRLQFLLVTFSLIAGKQDELKQLLGEMTTFNLMSLMGENGPRQKQRKNERQQKREERKAQGMADEEIAKLEAEEDAQAEEEALKKSTGNTVQDLEV